MGQPGRSMATAPAVDGSGHDMAPPARLVLFHPQSWQLKLKVCTPWPRSSNGEETRTILLRSIEADWRSASRQQPRGLRISSRLRGLSLLRLDPLTLHLHMRCRVVLHPLLHLRLHLQHQHPLQPQRFTGASWPSTSRSSRARSRYSSSSVRALDLPASHSS